MSANIDTPAPTPPRFTGEQWLALGRTLQAAGRHGDAVAALQQAASRLPLDTDVYRALTVSLDATGQKADAASARLGADAILRRSALDMFDIGRVYGKHRQWEAAAHWQEKALLIDPGLASAHIALAWALRELGRPLRARAKEPDATVVSATAETDDVPHAAAVADAAAAAVTDMPDTSAAHAAAGVIDDGRRNAYKVYRRQPAFIAAKAKRRRTVLVLCSSQRANLPFRHLVRPALSRMVRWVMDEGVKGIAHGRSRELPRYDIIFNAIADADNARSCNEEQARFMATDHGPLLNPPASIERTYRERTGTLLAGIQDILVPATLRWDRQSNPTFVVHSALAAAGIGYPAIVRRVGEHGGEGLVVLNTAGDLPELPALNEMYLTQYHEYRSPDGHYRKYRVIFIDRVPYPYHLAIGSQWLLHYFSADMLSAQWKLDEERRFLDDPEQALGKKAWTALHAIARRMDLDYCGIDFSLLPDGRVLVFETNASMLVHPESEDDGLRFKNVYIDRIFNAFEALMARRTAD
ncbi:MULTISPECIES: tetratricopeptide repeat protein [unclassified Achromobacter]|uniref:tetratricopeptide repeat protein n=1 Tax=unclassified Achromobacter TaxID=2626865 RepID=UPI000B5164F5|nr:MULTISPECIES: tetratricopeptide repeat protein [unclassified Achromobacter]OWT77322.1 hypothetical protein CEY04_15315 [Achromobacter sp. HZ28]OWT78203.1 hypothetical protein CEY05_09810 [Achromobacter sp. HZ34]